MSLRNRSKDRPKEDEFGSEIIGQWVAMGMCFGITVGSLIDSIGLGISLGMCFGAAIGSAISENKKRKKSGSSQNEKHFRGS